MCGIAGIFSKDYSSLEKRIVEMRDAIFFRGEDGYGHIVFPQDGGRPRP